MSASSIASAVCMLVLSCLYMDVIRMDKINAFSNTIIPECIFEGDTTIPSHFYIYNFGPLSNFYSEDDYVEVTYRQCKLVFKENSWAIAKAAGYKSFERIIYRLKPEWFAALDRLIDDNHLVEVHFSSTWRPESDQYSSVHFLGKGMDITYLEDYMGDYCYFNIDSTDYIPFLADQIFNWAKRSDAVRQYIDPWHAFGVVNPRLAILSHADHLHLTIK